MLLLDHSYTIDEAAGWSLAASWCLTWQTLQTLHPRMNPLHFHVNERVTAAAKPKGICDDHRYAAQICAWHGSDTLCDKETVSVLFQRASQRALGESGWHNNNVHHQSKTNACTLGPLPWTALRTTHSCRYQCVILIKRETLEVISGKVLFPPHWLYPTIPVN